MTIAYHKTQFYELPVIDFKPELGIENPSAQVYRLAFDYDKEIDVKEILETFLKVPRAAEVPALIIGEWRDSYENSERRVRPTHHQSIYQISKVGGTNFW